MSIAFAGYLSGYNGSFPFDKPGDSYGENSYVGMRMVRTLYNIWLISINLLVVYQECCSLIGYATHYLFSDS